MRTRTSLVFLLCVTLPIAALAQTSATTTSSPTFKYVTIDVPGSTATKANSINYFGTIVGTYTKNSDPNAVAGNLGFTLSNGKFTTISVPGSIATFANGVNGSGDVVGTFVTASNQSGGFLLHNGSFTKMSCGAQGLNDTLTVVGIEGSSACIWKSGTSQKFSLPTTPGGRTVLTGISNTGEMVGWVFTSDNDRAFIDKGSDLDYFEPSGSRDDQANGINTRGDVVGLGAGIGYFAVNPEAGESSSDSPENSPSKITIDFPGAIASTPHGLNYNRAIVGDYFDSQNHQHGFLAAPESRSGISGTFEEDILRPTGNNATSDQVGVIIIDVSNGSVGDSHITLDSAGRSPQLLANTTWQLRFCDMPVASGAQCIAITTVTTDANGVAQKDFTFPANGASSGVFFLSRNGIDDFLSGVQQDNSSFYTSRLQPLAALGYGNTKDFGQPGNDPMTNGQVVHHDFTMFHIQVTGAKPLSSYEVSFCSRIPGRTGCKALGSVSTDTNGNGSTEVQFSSSTNQNSTLQAGAFLLSRGGVAEYLSGFFVKR